MSSKPFELFGLLCILFFQCMLWSVTLAASNVDGLQLQLDESNYLTKSLDETFRMNGGILRGEENLKRLGMKALDDIYQKNMFTLSSLQNIRNINEIRRNYLHYSNPFIHNNKERNVDHSSLGDYNFHILFKCRNVEKPILLRNSMDESLLESGKVSHLAMNTFSMRASLENVKDLLSNDNIEWIGQIDPIFKFHIGEFQDQELLETQSQESSESTKSQQETPIQFISMTILLEMNQEIETVSEQLRHFTQSINNGQLIISKLVEHSESIAITVRKDHALAIAYEIGKLSSVIWIEPMHANYEMNKYSKRIINYGSDAVPEQGKSYFNGLTGKDEVITVVDGTFDTLSCFFYDPNEKVEQIRTLNESNINLSSNHRKVKMHFGLIDLNSNDYDHGTHVAATVAGYSSIPELYDYRGIASEAKLALVQLGCAKPGGCTCDSIPGCACKSYANSTCPQRRGATYQPLEPHKSVHIFTYEMMNSRIQTNSWGGGTSYNLYAMYTDRYIWQHKDLIVLFSAGNSGNDGFKSIGAQAQTKNGLAVGASHNSFQARREHELMFKQPPALDDIRKEILASLNCSVAVEECAFFMTDFNVCSTDGFCARSNISYATGNCGCAAGASGDRFCGKCVFDSLNTKGLQIDSMATFSSRGPTPDLRIKPDVNAPGADVLSARSYSSTKYSPRLTCSDTYKSPVDAIRATRGTRLV
ncbi:predicted protein [Naegleria gruberi]|uniref:Predicted protein n=1 Tax=Naegleria gruberi TaxID=5762 RepID=D2VJS1_NAEGR|nr:uncharacterized protein NAEGRDRAFT_80216 [Naegleria gruberi]EFC43081.1 predicted protein [Naegleria gruberi]|eukprot:XP_002675825.1 predicted protein [Naegleria gruberi strain NEG-M]